jgi:hypothetical protein
MWDDALVLRDVTHRKNTASTVMSTQEKITQLALAALRSAPPSAGIPKPATFMSPFEKPRAVALVAGSNDIRYERTASSFATAGAAASAAAWPFARREVWL